MNKIGANRVAIVDSFSPVVIHIYSIILLSNQELSIMQISGFFITIAGLLILTYENDYDDIDYKTKDIRSGRKIKIERGYSRKIWSMSNMFSR